MNKPDEDKIATTEDIDRSDLPIYDEVYQPETKHKIGLTVFVRNLSQTSDQDMDSYLQQLSGIFPENKFERISASHNRLYHDEVDCPAEEIDPFELASSRSYT